jgi:hypothetical protein
MANRRVEEKLKVTFKIASVIKGKSKSAFIHGNGEVLTIFPRAPLSLQGSFAAGTGISGTKGGRCSVAGADKGPICPSVQVSPRARLGSPEP